jgi:NADPH:quinone reductase-like Zn-dependent oxidoreductase
VFPVILGRDFAGPAVGDELYGFVRHASPAVGAGSWAERIAVPADTVAAKPRTLDFDRAGAVPIAALTALAAFDALAPESGDVVSRSADASLLKNGGRLASPLGAAGDGAGRFDVMAEADSTKLQRLADLLDAGRLHVPIQRLSARAGG